MHDGNQPSQIIKPSHPQPYSSFVSVDPNHILTEQVCQKFRDLHTQFNDIFNPAVLKYNGASGNIHIEAHINMGPILPLSEKRGYHITTETN